MTVNIGWLPSNCKHSTFTVFFFKKELYTGEGCVEMDIPWQLCWTVDPLTLHSQEMNSCLATANIQCLLSFSSKKKRKKKGQY